MADKHDKSDKHGDPKGKDQSGKPFEMNLELGGEVPTAPEEVEEVIEVVEEAISVGNEGDQPLEVVPVDEVIEVVESASDISIHPPDGTEDIVEEVVEVVEMADESSGDDLMADPNKTQPSGSADQDPKTQVPGQPGATTMVAPADKVDISQPEEEVLEAEAVSDPQMAGRAATGRKGKDTSHDIDLSGEARGEVLDAAGAPPSSGTIAAALAEPDDVGSGRKNKDTSHDIDLSSQGGEEVADVIEAPPSSATIAAALAEPDDLGSVRKDKDTSHDIDLGAHAEEEILDVVEAPPSSATIAAALAEPDDEPTAQRQEKQGDEEDKPLVAEGSEDDSKKTHLAGAGEMEVVVEYEEVLTESESEIDLGRKPTPKGERPSGVDAIAEALESGVDLDRAKAQAPTEHKTSRDDSDLAYESIMSEGAEVEEVDSSSVDLGSGQRPALGPQSSPDTNRRPLGAEEGDAAAEQSAVVGDEALIDSAEAAKEGDSEILVTPKKKTVAAKATDWDQGAADEVQLEEELPGLSQPAAVMAEAGGATATITKPAKQRGSATPFLAGGILATLLLAIAAGAVWYFSPGLIPESPNAVKTQPKTTNAGPAAQPAPVVASKAEEARQLIDEGKFDQAIEVAKGDDKAEQAARGLATYKKLEKEAKGPLSPNDENVKKALKEIEEGGAKTVADDIRRTLDLQAQLAAQAVAVKEADAAAARAKMLESTLDEVQLPKKADELKSVMAQYKQAWDTTQAAMKSLADAKLISADQKIDPTTVSGAINKVLKARDDLNAQLATVDDALKNVNAALKKAGVKEGDKGVDELEGLRDGAVKDRDMLNVAIDAALKELKEANYLTNDADKTKQLVESTKKARLAGQSPLGTSLGAMVNALGGLTKEPGSLFKKALDNAKLAADLKAAQFQLALTETPEHRLDTMIALLSERGYKDPKELKSFANYIEWTRSKESKASPESRGPRHCMPPL